MNAVTIFLNMYYKCSYKLYQAFILARNLTHHNFIYFANVYRNAE